MKTEETYKGTKKGAWIETFTGIKFNVFKPRQKDVDIRDIAHALSMCTRFNGHLAKYYSVAEHSIIMSYLVKPKHALAALLHDAAEANLSDVPRPIKYMLPSITELDAAVSDVIFKKYGISDIDSSIHELDRALCLAEANDSGMHTEDWNEGHDKYGYLNVKIYHWDWKTAEDRFLARFRNLLWERKHA